MWESTDEEGYTVKIEEYASESAALDRLNGAASGTAVILHGTGRNNTWDSPTSYKVHKFLSQRYFRLGNGDVTVFVQHPGSHTDRSGQLRRVVPMEEYLNNHGEEP